MIRKNRKSALEHYQVNAGGEYVYTGAWYTYLNEGKSRKQALTGLWAAAGAAGVCSILCGCIPAPGARDTFYVVLPLMVELILSLTVLWSLGQATLGGDPMKEYTYRDSVEKLPGRFLATAVFGGITILGLLLRMILGGLAVLDLALMGAEAANVVLSLSGRKQIRSLSWVISGDSVKK